MPVRMVRNPITQKAMLLRENFFQKSPRTSALGVICDRPITDSRQMPEREVWNLPMPDRRRADKQNRPGCWPFARRLIRRNLERISHHKKDRKDRKIGEKGKSGGSKGETG